MKITQREIDSAVVLDLNGKLTGGPDAETFREVFKSLVDQGKTLLMVTHDQELAGRASRVVEMADGQIVRH